MEMVDSIGEFITKVGFPTFVALYVLMRMEPVIKRMDKSIVLLTAVVAKLGGMSEKDLYDIQKWCGNGHND